MKCYLCLIAPTGLLTWACAICQHCGAAICEQHLICIQPLSGMAGGGRQTLVCLACCGNTRGSASFVQQSSQALPSLHREKRWRRWLTRWKQGEPLPEPARVIEAVEQLLKHGREQP